MKSADKNIHFLKEFIDIENHKTGLFIESTDFNSPVLLFLHGGPGFPQYASIKNAGLAWAKDFTVCYWEQRGTGMSYNAKTQGEITLERLVADTLVITNYLKEKFDKNKIIICGHSWGSLLGSIVSSRYPEHYDAYIGIGQFGRHFESNQETYTFLLETAIERKDERAVKDIRSVTFDEGFYKNAGYRRILEKYLNKYGGGARRTGYSNLQGMKELFTCKAYSWGERFNIPKGSFASYDAFGKTMAKTDASILAPHFDIPVFIVQGIYDYQTTYNEAKRFYEKIEAPIKKMYTFEDAAHSPFLEDQARFLEILKRDVLPLLERKQLQ